jgi:hypothetical protein
MTQPVFSTVSQRSLTSLHSSVVQLRPSLQSRAVLAQLPDPSQASLIVQNKPSEHEAPAALSVHAVVELPGLQL